MAKENPSQRALAGASVSTAADKKPHTLFPHYSQRIALHIAGATLRLGEPLAVLAMAAIVLGGAA